MIDPTTECGVRNFSVSWPSELVWDGVLKSVMAIAASPSESQSSGCCTRLLTWAAGLGVCDTSCLLSSCRFRRRPCFACWAVFVPIRVPVCQGAGLGGDTIPP